MTFQARFKVTASLIASMFMPHVAGFMFPRYTGQPSSFIHVQRRKTVPEVAFSAVKLDTIVTDKEDNRNVIPKEISLYLAMGISFLLLQSLTATPAVAATETNYGTNSAVLGRNSVEEYIQLEYSSVLISDMELLGGTASSTELSIDRNDEKKPVKTNLAQEGGKGFFIIYVVFSFLAGGVEMTKRFQKWLENRQ